MNGPTILHVLPAPYPQAQYALALPRVHRFPAIVLICPNAHRHISPRPLPVLLWGRPTMCALCGLHMHQEGHPR